MKKLICQLGFVIGVTALVTGCSTMCQKQEESNVSWDKVPTAVQSTIQSHQYGGTVGKIEKETMKCGTVYEAKVKGPDGKNSEVKVAEDGKLLKYKTSKD